MTNQGRRTFLRSSLIGAGGAMLSRPLMAGSNFRLRSEDIITRTLGKTGLEIPVLSMGVMRSDTPSLVAACLDAGLKYFDTANGYMRGRNEEMLGRVFKDIPRDSFFIGTKVKAPPGTTKDAFLSDLETSLNRLQMDHVDILYLHGAVSRQEVMNETILDALQTAKSQGKTRFVGVSTHGNEPEVINAAAEAGSIDVVLVAINFMQDHYAAIKTAMARGAEQGIGFIGMKTMAGGFLDQERQIPVNGKAALKWALQDQNLTTCIPGFTAFNELQEDAGILTDLTLTPEEQEHIRRSEMITGLYCNQCGQCREQCPKGLPIPDMMRSYMYTYGYGELRQARDLLDEARVQPDPCRDCGGCTVSCIKGFPVAERIADVSRLSDVPYDFLT